MPNYNKCHLRALQTHNPVQANYNPIHCKTILDGQKVCGPWLCSWSDEKKKGTCRSQKSSERELNQISDTIRVFYQRETRLYNSAPEATKDMVNRGFRVCIIKPAEDPMEEMQRRMWRSARGESSQDQAQSSTLGYKEKLQAFRRSTEVSQE